MYFLANTSGNFGLLCGIFFNFMLLYGLVFTFWVFRAFYAVLSRIKFCCNLRPFSGKIILAQNLLCKNCVFLHVCCGSQRNEQQVPHSAWLKWFATALIQKLDRVGLVYNRPFTNWTSFTTLYIKNIYIKKKIKKKLYLTCDMWVIPCESTEKNTTNFFLDFRPKKNSKVFDILLRNTF